MKNSIETSKVRFASGTFQLRWGLRLAIRGLSNQLIAFFQIVGVLLKLCLSNLWFPFALCGRWIVWGVKALYSLFLSFILKCWNGLCLVFDKIREGILYLLRHPARFLLWSGMFCWRVFVKFLGLLVTPLMQFLLWLIRTWCFRFVCKFSLLFLAILVGIGAYGIVAFYITDISVSILSYLYNEQSLFWGGPLWLSLFKSTCVAFFFCIVWSTCNIPNRAFNYFSSYVWDDKKWDIQNLSACIWLYVLNIRQSFLSKNTESMKVDFALISTSVKSKSFFSFSIASVSALSFAFLATSCSGGLQLSANLLSVTFAEVKVGSSETSSDGSKPAKTKPPSLDKTSKSSGGNVEKTSTNTVDQNIEERAVDKQDSIIQKVAHSIFQVPSNWREESSFVIERNGIAVRKFEDLEIDISRLCSAKSIVSVGTASADGPKALNKELAYSRGVFLARLISSSFDLCGTKHPDVWVHTKPNSNWLELPSDGRKILAFDLKHKSTMMDVQRELKRVGAWDSDGKLCWLSSSTNIKDENACKNESISKWMRN